MWTKQGFHLTFSLPQGSQGAGAVNSSSSQVLSPLGARVGVAPFPLAEREIRGLEGGGDNEKMYIRGNLLFISLIWLR